MNEERLKELISGLRLLSPEEYDQRDVVSKYDGKTNCGAVCCAIGWTPRFFPDLVEWADLYPKDPSGKNLKLTNRESPDYYEDIAKELFDLTWVEVQALFGPPGQGSRGGARLNLGLSHEMNMKPEDFTARYVASDIEEFIRLKSWRTRHKNYNKNYIYGQSVK